MLFRCHRIHHLLDRMGLRNILAPKEGCITKKGEGDILQSHIWNLGHTIFKALKL